MGSKRVVHLIPNLNSGGCENQLLRLLPRVRGYQHTVLTILEEGSLAANFRQAGMEVISLNIGRFSAFWRYGRILRALKELNPDRVVTYLFVPDMLGRLLIRPFTSYRPTPFLRSTYLSPSLAFRSIRLFEKLTKGLTRHYLANSESVKRAFVKNIGVPASKITVISNGLNLENFPPVDRQGKKRQELELKDADFVISCVANFHESKGHKYLIGALPEIILKQPTAKILLIGEGVEADNLKKQAAALNLTGKVRFLGRRTDVAGILGLSNAFVLPTIFEGMSNALMEAMAVGLPCVVTDIEPNQELIKNEENGLLIPVRDASAVAKQLIRLTTDSKLGDRLGQAARQTITERYDINVVAKQFEEYLRRD